MLHGPYILYMLEGSTAVTRGSEKEASQQTLGTYYILLPTGKSASPLDPMDVFGKPQASADGILSSEVPEAKGLASLILLFTDWSPPQNAILGD